MFASFLIPPLSLLALDPIAHLPSHLSTLERIQFEGVPRPQQQPKQHLEFTTSWHLSLNTASSYSWNLPNGNVQFNTPLIFSGAELGENGQMKSASDDSFLSLSNPVFLGSGGSGAVFSFSIDESVHKQTSSRYADNQVAIKVSWKASSSSVENECNILQILEPNNDLHVERCICMKPYPYEEGRVMIALTPVLSDRTSSISNVNSADAKQNAVKQVVETMVKMLRANIITVDVQPLFSVETGDVYFIDFTEARQMTMHPTVHDVAAVVGFCNEMFALVPEYLRGVASIHLKALLEDMGPSGISLPAEVHDIVESVWLD